jgi:hypothetical protein
MPKLIKVVSIIARLVKKPGKPYPEPALKDYSVCATLSDGSRLIGTLDSFHPPTLETVEFDIWINPHLWTKQG